MPVGPNHKGFPMRSLLTFGNKLLPCLVAMGVCAAVCRAETIIRVDSSEARSIGLAEASGAKSFDVDLATITHCSIAMLSNATPAPPAQTMLGSDTESKLPLAMKTALREIESASAKARMGKPQPWLAENSLPTPRGIDPYPSWSGAVLVVDDVSTVLAEGTDTGGYHVRVRPADGKAFAMVGSQFFTP